MEAVRAMKITLQLWSCVSNAVNVRIVAAWLKVAYVHVYMQPLINPMPL